MEGTRLDQNRFDDLSRTLATGLSRRATLKAAGAAALGLLGLRASTAEAQVSQLQCGNKFCASNPAICNDGCVCCVYPNGNSRCRPPGACAPGVTVCPDGEIADPILGCVAAVGCPPFTTAVAGECVDPCEADPDPCTGDCQSCAAAPNGSSICFNRASLLCEAFCSSDADCTDPLRPQCVRIVDDCDGNGLVEVRTICTGLQCNPR